MVLEKEPGGAMDAYETLLVEYASGCLDEAHALVVSTHITLSPSARKAVARSEALGGSMLQDCCSPVEMKKDALDCVMAKLDRAEKISAECEEKLSKAENGFMPSCLQKYMHCPCSALGWKKAGDGLHTVSVKTTCSGSKARLMKVEAGKQVGPHMHGTQEITLVLEGSFRDHNRSYARGDLVVMEKDIAHVLFADDQAGCICLVVRKRPSRLSAVLNFFRR